MILRFRHPLEEQGLTQQIFAEIAGLLAQQRLLLGSGTIWMRPSSRRRARPRTRPRPAILR